MGVQTIGSSGNILEVDATFKASRSTVRPMECLNWYSIGTPSGALTGVAANAAVFSFRNIGANPIAVRRTGVGFIATTGFTAAQKLDYGLMVARAFSASDSGGNAVLLIGNNAKMRSSLGTVTAVDCRISAAAALTAGTKTLDTNHLAQVGGWALAAAAGVILAPSANNLLQHDTGDYPLVLATNEGFNIMNLTAMGAAGVGSLYVNFEFAEVLTY
jgi:hypothetical protein